MFHRSVPLPAPFHSLTVFALIEPVAETKTEVQMAHRLYVVAPFAPGGRILLLQVEGQTLPRYLFNAELAPATEGV